MALVPEGNLLTWFQEVAPSMRRIGDEMFPVLLTPEILDSISLDDLAHLERQPINKQIPLTKTVRWFIEQQRPLILCVEPGGGKTLISVAGIAPYVYAARAKNEVFRTVIVAPGHLTHNWYREIRMVIPDAKILIAHHAGDLMPHSVVTGISYKPLPKRRRKAVVVNDYPNAPLAEAEFIITNYEAISRTSNIRPAAANGYVKERRVRHLDGRQDISNVISYDAHEHQATRALVCPDCGAQIMVSTDDYADATDLEKEQRFCGAIRKKRVAKDNGAIWKPSITQTYTMVDQMTKRGEPKRCGAALWQYVADPLPLPHNGFGRAAPGAFLRDKTVRPPAWDKEIWSPNGYIIAHRSPTAVRQRMQHEEPQPLQALGSVTYTLKSQQGEKTYTRTGSRKMDLDRILRNQFPYRVNLAIVDEVHMAKSGESARGIAAGNVAGLADSQLVLTGTITGGYSSTLFYLLWRFSSEIRNDFGYREMARWVEQYGMRQMTYRAAKDDVEEGAGTGKASRRKAPPPRVREIPGLSAAAMHYLLSDAVFSSQNEVFPYPMIPRYTDHTLPISLDTSESIEITYEVRYHSAMELKQETVVVTQQSAYQIIEGILQSAAKEMLMRNDRGLLAITLQTLLRWPNACTYPIEIIHPRTKQVFLKFPGLPKEWIYPKERWLLEQCHRWKEQGHKPIIYVAHVGDIDVGARLKEVLEREYQGKTLRVALLRSTTVDVEDREDWIRAQMADSTDGTPGADLLICNPQLVETGLNLIQFSRVVMYQMIYSAYTLAQCVRRVLRYGQPHDVEVHYPQYRKAFEIFAAKLMAMKMRTLAQVSGRMEDAFTQNNAGNLDLQGMLVKHLKGGLDLNVDGSDLQQILDGNRQLEEQKVQEEINEFRRNFHISDETAMKLEQFLEDPFESLDLEFMEDLFANLTPEEFNVFLNPFDDVA